MSEDRRSATNEFVPPATRAAVGLPEANVVRTVHNRAARKTIVEVELREMPPVHRLYWRCTGQPTYEAMEALGPTRSMQDVVSCEAACCFVRDVRWTPRGNAFGGSSLGLLRVDLEEAPFVQSLDLTDILPPNATISRLLRANDAGTSVDAVISIREQQGEGGRKRARYILCALDLAARRLVELDTLAGVYF